MVERSVGCSYDDIIATLEEHYGQLATVAAACINMLTTGPKLGNRDFKGLLNFAEQLQCASRRLEGEYEHEASTTSNMKMKVARLPDYIINKWADVSYSIREKGQNPKLKDLAQLVKRQAAIKIDPGFVGVSLVTSSEVKGNRTKSLKVNNRSFIPEPTRQTSSFTTDVKGKSTGRKLPSEGRNSNTPANRSCLCCPRSHELPSCLEFQKKDLQSRWDIVKVNRLCHVCLRVGHLRGRCESPKFCPCGSDKRHHNLLHNPPSTRRDNDRLNQASTEEPNAAVTDPLAEVVGEQGRSGIRHTVQYATVTQPGSTKTVFLHPIPVKITSPDGRSVTTYGLLDNASRGTMISGDVAKALGLKGHKEFISLAR